MFVGLFTIYLYQNMTLETPRLLLRRFTIADADAFYQFNKSPEVVKYTGNVPTTSVAEAQEIIETVVLPQYQQHNIGRLAVIEKSSGRLFGFCGLRYMEDEDVFDLGYRFAQDMWGKGYATEACEEVIRNAFEDLKLESVIGRAFKVNPASIRVLEKVGMQYKKDCICSGEDSVWYELNYIDYLANKY